MVTSPKDRQHRLGQPSLFRPLAIAAAAVVVALAIFLAIFAGQEEPGGEEADMEDASLAEEADDGVDGQGAEPEGIGGAADPGTFADAPTPLEEGSSANATSATQGDEMMDLPPDPPGGGRVNPEEVGRVAGEIAEEDEVPEQVRESDVRTALPDEGDGDAAGTGAAGEETSGDQGESDGSAEAGESAGAASEQNAGGADAEGSTDGGGTDSGAENGNGSDAETGTDGDAGAGAEDNEEGRQGG